MTTINAGRNSPCTGSFTRIRARISESAWPYRLLVLLIVGAVWEIYARVADVLLFPTFTGTVIATVELATDPVVWSAFLISNESFIIGFAIGFVLAIPLGLAAGRFRGFEAATNPYLSIMLVTPMAALIPLLLMSLGLGLASRVLLVFVFAFPVIAINSRAGVRQASPDLIEMASSFGANERAIWRKILLPSALPAIMTGVRLGLGRAVTGMVIVELLMIAVGIGGLILDFEGRFQAERLYGLVIWIVVEALVLISVARAVERRLAPWATDTVLRE